MKKNKRIIISVTNDLSTDQRVKKVCESLLKLDYDLLLIGRILPESLAINRPYSCKRLKLIFNKGPLFYAEYNLRLFILLLFSKADIFHANDLDTLLANFIAAKLRGKTIVYDSHEYFTGVPEIQHKKFVKKTWQIIEGYIFPKLEYIFTINQSIANLYQQKYNKKLIILRNIPRKLNLQQRKTKLELGIPMGKDIIILQGAGINMDRGAEELIEAMKYLKNTFLLIIGDGDVIKSLKKKVLILNLKDSVLFKGKMPYLEMMQYTKHAQLGITLDKDTNINYKFSLPNKLFDYIQAGIPILASKIEEVEKVIKNYEIGLLIDNHEPIHIAEKIQFALSHKESIKKWTINLETAAKELNWENEETFLIETYKKIER